MKRYDMVIEHMPEHSFGPGRERGVIKPVETSSGDWVEYKDMLDAIYGMARGGGKTLPFAKKRDDGIKHLYAVTFTRMSSGIKFLIISAETGEKAVEIAKEHNDMSPEYQQIEEVELLDYTKEQVLAVGEYCC